MQKELQIFTRLQKQDQPIDPGTLDDLEMQEMQIETIVRLCIREALIEHAVQVRKELLPL